MRPYDQYLGSGDPFEGDRTLWLRSLPAGARVTAATVKLAPQGGPQFAEVITFLTDEDQGDWGTTRVPTSDFVEVDFHARRTLASVRGTSPTPVLATLQIDMGGVYVDVLESGAIKGPGDSLFRWSLSSNQDTDLPGLVVNKFKFMSSGASPNLSRVTIRSVPTNVSVRLDEMPPFWSHLGELVTTQTSPDFANVLNAFLVEAAAENGFYAIPFVIHSDTIARLNVELMIDYVIEQPILPPYLPEVTLPYGYSSLPGIERDLLTVNLPRGATVASTGGAVQGAFDASRVVFPKEIDPCETETTVTVSPDRSLAQPIQLAEETPASGIDLPLAKTKPGLAGLHLALQADADGKPSGEVLTEAEVTVEKPVPGGSAWGSAALPAEFRFEKGKRYWLVLQSLSGDAYWNVGPGDPATPPLQASPDGGFSWRIAATDAGQKPLAAIFRLRHTPERFSLPVQLEVGEGTHAKRVKFDRFAPLGRVEFDLDFAKKLQEYLDSPAAVSPCGSGNLLINGSFDQPPHDDATRRLFGFDARWGAPLVGAVDLRRGVDLSVERFIALEVIEVTDPIRIDCAGANPAHTSLNEIIDAINRAVGFEVAFEHQSDDSPPLGTGRLELIKGSRLYWWCKPEVPAGWQGVPGQLIRYKLPETGQILALLLAARVEDAEELERIPCFLADPSAVRALTGEPARLSQRIPVEATCSYVLEAVFFASPEVVGHEEQPPALWQVDWLDANGGSIHTSRGTLDVDSSYRRSPDLPWLYEARVTAPPGAVQAQLSVIQPSPGVLGLESISFAPTFEALSNGSFLYTQDDALANWRPSQGQYALQDEGVVLSSVGTVLSQTAGVVAEERYELRVQAWPAPPPDNDPEMLSLQQRARLELHWLADEDEIGEPVILPLDGRGFPTHAWAGTAPKGATQAKIRLIQPQGKGDLVVRSVSLSRSDLVSVPLTFLAEAPGELSVSDLRVAYEPAGEAEEDLDMQREEAAARARMPVAEPRSIRSMEAWGPTRLAVQPVGIIADVGAVTESSLTDAGITTVGDLAALDLAQPVTGIGSERLLKLKTRAELTLAIWVPPDAFPMLAAESLEALLFASPSDLATRSGRPLAEIEALQRDLRALRLYVNEAAFRDLILSDLIPGGE